MYDTRNAGPASGTRPNARITSIGTGGRPFVDYKNVDDLRRLMTPNGKIYPRKRTGATAREQRMLSQAIKRARYMGLLPYTSATL